MVLLTGQVDGNSPSASIIPLNWSVYYNWSHPPFDRNCILLHHSCNGELGNFELWKTLSRLIYVGIMWLVIQYSLLVTEETPYCTLQESFDCARNVSGKCMLREHMHEHTHTHIQTKLTKLTKRVAPSGSNMLQCARWICLWYYKWQIN